MRLAPGNITVVLTRVEEVENGDRGSTSRP